ncbi:SCO2525 family SAM-dependent methyltransferase [Rugosimonospora acidiphila]|uniref:SCO2525 family SAM-dependent methyltransferase n=2 Tax=Rugosimonospora acidiphila TaxID=556531 RepID=A0ABP9SIM5_9ACTN
MNTPSQSNDLQPWDDFDSAWYLAHNYKTLRFDDREIIERMATFLASSGPGLSGIDVGSGTNLYPSLAMLPSCRSIAMVERARSNVGWLREEIRGYAPTWDPFWGALINAQADRYKPIEARRLLAERAGVQQGSIFSLPRGRWDIGTMFFVAESITARPDEFERATQSFVRSLRQGAPFAAAFMRHSTGYRVNGLKFPAVSVGEAQVDECLAPVAYDVTVTMIPSGKNPLRDGYDGMILATGYASGS